MVLPFRHPPATDEAREASAGQQGAALLSALGLRGWDALGGPPRDLMSRAPGAAPQPPAPPPALGSPANHSVPFADVPWDAGRQIQDTPTRQDGWLALVPELSQLCKVRHLVLVSQLLKQPFLPHPRTPAVQRRD